MLFLLGECGYLEDSLINEKFKVLLFVNIKNIVKYNIFFNFVKVKTNYFSEGYVKNLTKKLSFAFSSKPCFCVNSHSNQAAREKQDAAGFRIMISSQCSITNTTTACAT